MTGTYLFVLIFCFLKISLCDDKPHVTTPLGEVRGSTRTTPNGRKYAAFEGIPFAIPPIGDRRFEAPEPVEPWTGIWDANFLTECVQSTIPNVTFVTQMDEDCLHINVYVPREVPNPDEKLDVIVHIHGGAYMYGSGHHYNHPQFIMDHDVIFATFNYRLGILGFLSTEDEVLPGNNGLKDQVMALKWVQENIASFGGNPDSVTITGLSAGASSVHLHYFSEMSKGLFHRGISHSGVALNSFSIQEKPLKKAQILAEGAGCPTSPTQELVECLKQRPHQHLLAQLPQLFGLAVLPLAPLAPVVEKGSKPFLKAHPYELLSKGEVLDVPWIASNTAHEGHFPMPLLSSFPELEKNWEDWAPYILDYDYTIPKSSWKNVAKKIKDFYFGKDQTITEENISKMTPMVGDRIFLVDAEIAVKEQAKVAKSPVYYYLFSYPGDSEHGMVGHGADYKYFSGVDMTGKALTENEIKMKDFMLKVLVSFAKTGKPTIEGVNWDPTGHDKLTYLNISSNQPEEVKLQTVEEIAPRGFWKSLGFQENENLFVGKDEL